MEYIFERVFGYLDYESILNCRLGCKSWNAILSNPSFWLKKLKTVGLPLEVYTKWMKIKNKFDELRIPKREITKALHHSYAHVMTKSTHTLGDSFMIKNDCLLKRWMSRPPIVVACTLGLMDVVKVLAELNEKFDVKYPDKHYFVTITRHYFLEFPIFLAMVEKHFEIVDFILPKMTTPPTEIRRDNKMPLFIAAAESGHLNLVKRLLPLVRDVYEPWEYRSALHFAIRGNNMEVVKFLAHIFDVNVYSLPLVHPLHMATIYKNTAAVKILVPLTNTSNLQKEMQRPFTSIECKQIINEEINRRGL